MVSLKCTHLILQMSVEHGHTLYMQGVAGGVVVEACTMYELLLLVDPPQDRLTRKDHEFLVLLLDKSNEF